MSDAALFDKKKLSVWFVLLGVAGFLLFIFNQDNAFPSSSLQFKIPREKIQQEAADLAKELGFTQDSKIKSTVFQTDQSTTLFLQHHYGPKEADQLIKNQLPCFYWNSRFCSPGQLEEFEVDRTPDGKLVALVHKVPNDLTLPSLKPEEGSQAFRAFLQKHTNLDPDQFKQLSFKSEHKKSRDDLSYTFEDQKRDYKGARLRLDFTLAGNQISL
ncbi:MAG: hypothetical protein K2X81_01210, partial [Candidatus Obscuribacterales bacterium]|nr:hypothetical protein [Candidatus Obscuribacterales bacterium]